MHNFWLYAVLKGVAWTIKYNQFMKGKAIKIRHLWLKLISEEWCEQTCFNCSWRKEAIPIWHMWPQLFSKEYHRITCSICSWREKAFTCDWESWLFISFFTSWSSISNFHRHAAVKQFLIYPYIQNIVPFFNQINSLHIEQNLSFTFLWDFPSVFLTLDSITSSPKQTMKSFLRCGFGKSLKFSTLR